MQKLICVILEGQDSGGRNVQLLSEISEIGTGEEMVSGRIVYAAMRAIRGKEVGNQVCVSESSMAYSQS